MHKLLIANWLYSCCNQVLFAASLTVTRFSFRAVCSVTVVAQLQPQGRLLGDLQLDGLCAVVAMPFPVISSASVRITAHLAVN